MRPGRGPCALDRPTSVCHSMTGRAGCAFLRAVTAAGSGLRGCSRCQRARVVRTNAGPWRSRRTSVCGAPWLSARSCRVADQGCEQWAAQWAPSPAVSRHRRCAHDPARVGHVRDKTNPVCAAPSAGAARGERGSSRRSHPHGPCQIRAHRVRWPSLLRLSERSATRSARGRATRRSGHSDQHRGHSRGSASCS